MAARKYTPEEKEAARLRRNAKSAARRRERYGTGPEYRAKIKTKNARGHRKRRANPEWVAKERARGAKCMRERRAALTAEQLETKRAIDREAKRRQAAAMTPEQREHMNGAERRRNAAMTPEQRKHKRKKQREWEAANIEKVLEGKRIRGARYRRANPEKEIARHRRRRAENPAHVRAIARNSKRKRLPPHTRPEPAVCECCDRPTQGRALALDHCHKTKRFRGWLCSTRCNPAIGALGDDPAEAAWHLIRYWARFMGVEPKGEPELPECTRGTNKQTERAYKRLDLIPTRARPGACECCGNPPGKKALALDHDHTTGVFRGWLCHMCNSAIDKIGDDDVATALENLVRYWGRVEGKLNHAGTDVPEGSKHTTQVNYLGHNPL